MGKILAVWVGLESNKIMSTLLEFQVILDTNKHGLKLYDRLGLWLRLDLNIFNKSDIVKSHSIYSEICNNSIQTISKFDSQKLPLTLQE